MKLLIGIECESAGDSLGTPIYIAKYTTPGGETLLTVGKTKEQAADNMRERIINNYTASSMKSITQIDV